MEVLEIVVLHHPATSNVIKNILLSNNTVLGRNGEMAENVEVSLCKLLISNKFSLRIEESNLPCNVGFTVGVGWVCKEKNTALANIMPIVTDGAPANVCRHRGFIALLKWEIPDILAVHCVIHRPSFSRKKSQRPFASVIAIYHICCERYPQLYSQRLIIQTPVYDEEFNRLLLHTEIL
nr:uncharacterized protein LOC122272089 [Parasteatoda tepidariorum]